ncbi:general secretion pathway protein GspB [Massilia sp. UMI-21]|nr:general secretion pathway protein GspB [Massilia sp. UMI-21]
MSYILEALKKAQAERQLGSAPTIHAPAPGYAPAAAQGSRRPLMVGIGAGALVVALGALFLLRQPASAPAAEPAAEPALQVAAAPAPVAAPLSVPAPAVAAPAPATVQAVPVAPPAPPAPARVEPVKPKTPPAPAAKPAPAARAAVEAAPETPRPVLVAAAPAQAALPAEDGIGPLQSLPEALQREVPKVAFGGYIYSANPADRLLLVDKMLRREGEEVAPGLVLERLLPKAAIMNFRGYRYRVGY